MFLESQCNFDKGQNAKYASYNDGIAVLLDNKYYLFENRVNFSSSFPLPRFGTIITQGVDTEKNYEYITLQDVTAEQIKAYIDELKDNGWTALEDFNLETTIGGAYKKDNCGLSIQFAGDVFAIYYSKAVP